MTFTLSFKCVFDICKSLSLLTCSSASSKATYLYLAACISYTLYYTFLFTLFLVISKGYCITRNALFRQEVTVVAVLMSVVYLCYSAYTLDPGGLYPLVFLVMSAVLFTTARFAIRTIKTLRLHVAHLTQANVRELLVPAQKKLRVMKGFSRLLMVYFLTEMILAITLIPASSMSFSAYFANEIAQELCEICAVSLIFYLFRPRCLGPFSPIPLIDAGDLGEMHSVPPLYIANLPQVHLEDLTKLTPVMPLVILQPSDFNLESPYETLELGQLLPMISDARSSQSDLSIN